MNDVQEKENQVEWGHGRGKRGYSLLEMARERKGVDI